MFIMSKQSLFYENDHCLDNGQAMKYWYSAVSLELFNGMTDAVFNRIIFAPIYLAHYPRITNFSIEVIEEQLFWIKSYHSSLQSFDVNSFESSNSVMRCRDELVDAFRKCCSNVIKMKSIARFEQIPSLNETSVFDHMTRNDCCHKHPDYFLTACDSDERIKNNLILYYKKLFECAFFQLEKDITMRYELLYKRITQKVGRDIVIPDEYNKEIYGKTAFCAFYLLYACAQEANSVSPKKERKKQTGVLPPAEKMTSDKSGSELIEYLLTTANIDGLWNEQFCILLLEYFCQHSKDIVFLSKYKYHIQKIYQTISSILMEHKMQIGLIELQNPVFQSILDSMVHLTKYREQSIALLQSLGDYEEGMR